ncbi:MAG: hypothetical protein RL434_2150 [Pseudomonadota bacterium]
MPGKITRPLLLPILGLTLGLLAHPARADFNDGVAAMVAGDYAKALESFVPLAETADHAYAQYFLGRMYADGRGVERSPEEAAKWFRKAAEKGVQEAQFRLAGLYERGEGVPRDLEYAYAWFSVAAHLGSAKAGTARDSAAGQLAPAALKEAQALAADLTAKYGIVPRATSVSQ